MRGQPRPDARLGPRRRAEAPFEVEAPGERRDEPERGEEGADLHVGPSA
jgi:hypothetical protein